MQNKKSYSDSFPENIRKISASEVKITQLIPQIEKNDLNAQTNSQNQRKTKDQFENIEMSDRRFTSNISPSHTFNFHKKYSQSPLKQDLLRRKQSQKSMIWTNLTEFASSASINLPAKLSKFSQLQYEQRNVMWINKIQNIFIVNGIVSILYWNSVLSTLDYFSQVYEGHNVYLYFPIPNFVMSVLVAISFNAISTRISYKILLIVGICMINVCMALFLIISAVCKSTPAVGFYISIALCFAVGFFGSLVQLSYCGMINYFGKKTVANFNVGVGASGLFVTILRIVITAIYLSTHQSSSSQVSLTPVLIFFLIAIGFSFFGLALDIGMFKRKIYKERIIDTQKMLAEEKNKTTQEMQNKVQNQTERSHIKAESNPLQLSQRQKNSYARLLWGALKATKPYPIYIFLNGLFNFMLFPNLTMAKKTALSETWSNLTFLMMFNGGNLIGKIIGGQRRFVNSWTATYVVLCRLFFFYTIPFMDVQASSSDILLNNNIFPYVNQMIFSFSSGLLLNCCFILTFEVAPMKYKKYAGILNGTLYQIGVMIGTFIAVPLQYAVNPVQ